MIQEISRSGQNSTKLSQAKASQIISFLPYNYTKIIKDKKLETSINFNFAGRHLIHTLEFTTFK
jgi:hypothetical protein